MGRRGQSARVNAGSAVSEPASVRDADLFGFALHARMLVALLAVGVVLSLVALVVAAAGGQGVAVLAELAFVGGQTACIGWALRSRAVSVRGTTAVVAFNTACVTASNLLYPGPFRPFTAQLVLAVLFVCWFLPTRHMAAHLALLTVAGAVTLVGANPLGAEGLRVATVALSGAATGFGCRTLRNRHGRLTAQARLDPLTGIGNRRAYEERLASAVAHAERHDERLSLVLIDLDGFKQLNDAHGHPVGDAELQAVARLLTTRARRQDAVFRLGGDELPSC